MFLGSVITRVFAAHIKGTCLDFTYSEFESSGFKERGTGNQPFFPATLQVQWLTTRLRFWDYQSSWEMINALGGLYLAWLRWKDLKFKLEIHTSRVSILNLEDFKTKQNRRRKNWQILPFPSQASFYRQPEHLTSNNVEYALGNYSCGSFNRLIRVVS